MEAQTAQLREEIEQTRTAMADRLDLVKQHISHRVAATLDQTLIAPVRGVQATITRSTTVLHQAPWLITRFTQGRWCASPNECRLAPRNRLSKRKGSGTWLTT
jgi:hypothetical protein